MKIYVSEDKLKQITTTLVKEQSSNKKAVYFTFGYLGLWINGETKKHLPNKVYTPVYDKPITATYNTWEEWSNSPYFKTTNLDISHGAPMAERFFDNYIKQYGQMIVKEI